MTAASGCLASHRPSACGLTFGRSRTISGLGREAANMVAAGKLQMRAKRKTLRRADDLLAAGLIPLERRAAIEAVAARYALALTAYDPDLGDSRDTNDPSALQSVSDEAQLQTPPDEP